MRLRRRLIAMILVASTVPTALFGRAAVLACAVAPHSGEWVRIAEETAMIVWDESSKTEHFVRAAQFDTNSADFGFLVPTPTQPELGEVAPGLFEAAAGLTAARIVDRTRYVLDFGLADWLGDKEALPKSAAMPPGAMPAADAVEVLQQTEVAGLAAAVLRADDPKALADWLKEHGYETRPELAKWLAWYAEHRWVITAFKLAGKANGGHRLETKLIRMSFQAERPFYPYREPNDMRAAGPVGRSLRVYFVSGRKYEGTLGDSGTWPASTAWAGDFGGRPTELGGRLALAKGPTSAHYLTEFIDPSSPRPGIDEVYFRPATDPSPVERPPIINVHLIKVPGTNGTIALALLLTSVVAVGSFVAIRIRTTRGVKPARPDEV